MIELQQVSKYFTQAKQSFTALDDVNLSIPRGSVFGIIGKSGAGKSTLLRCINWLEVPEQGDVLIDNVSLKSLSQLELRTKRQSIAMIFQHFNLLRSATVHQNIALAMRIAHREASSIAPRVNELLRLVELEDKAQSYPRELSGGQKQRVAIARALANEPTILLCDEATSALDPDSTRSILALLKKINREYGLTIVLITHEMDVIKRICDHLAVIERGKIIEVAQTAALLQAPKSDVAKSWLMENLKPELPDYLRGKLHPEPNQGDMPIVQMGFYGEVASQAVISHLSVNVGVQINILQANIDAINQHSYGVITAQLIGDAEQLDVTFTYFKQKQIDVEVLAYVEPNSF